MPRHARLRLAEVPFHVIQRGNNRSPCFFSDEDYHRYLDDLKQQADKHGVAVHAYVLMTNHVHLLVTPRDADGIGRVMKFLGQRYVQYVNRTYRRSGSLWEGRYRSCLVHAEDYLMACHRYIESNPVRAGMVDHPAGYPWSSYRANAQGETNRLLTPHPLLMSLGATPEQRHAAYRELFRGELEPGLVDQIRRITNGGFALGDERFRLEVSKTLRRRAEPGKAGRPPRKAADEGQRKLALD